MQKRAFTVLVLLCCLLVSPATEARKTIVAVFDIEFKRVRMANSVRVALRDFIETRLTASGIYEVVPPDQLKKALSKQKIKSYRKCYKQTCQIKIGEELSADRTLSTRITRIGRACMVSMKLYHPGTLVVTGSPAGASTWITGPGGFSVVRGLPVTVTGARRGTYQVKVSREGYRAVQRQAAVNPGKATTVTVKLVKGGAAPGRAGITWIRSRPAGVSFGKTEVTLGQYRACVRAGACKAGTFKKKSDYKYCNWGHSGRERHPMNCVNWHGATAFCKWSGGRLPTENEWYAEASNGAKRKYPWGSETATCVRAVMDDKRTVGSAGIQTDGCGEDRTWAVCSISAGNSVSGLCDMSGNVLEWTSTAIGAAQVLCGGGWNLHHLGDLSSSARDRYKPSSKYSNVGFRCVRSSH